MEGVSHLRFLGPARIERDGEPLLTSPKLQAVLGYLAVEEGPVPREHLADLFWGDKPEERGRANLSWALHHLSTSLPGCFDADRYTVQFRQPSDCWSDVDAFQTLARRNDLDALAAAVDLYQGDFLEGLRLDGCPEFEVWLVGERERWRQRVAAILEELVAHYDQCGEGDQALRLARRLLALEPWREQTHRQVMRLLAQNGQRGAALAQYKTCRRLLADELNVEPGTETRELFERIRDGPPPAAPTHAPPHNLPAPLTPFVGREAQLVEVKRRLLDPDCRLLTLVGPGGIGKTRLALEAARDLMTTSPDAFPHGAYLVPLALLPSPEAIVPAVAEAVGCRLVPGRDREQQLLDCLRDRQVLLILDSFEHLLRPSPHPAGDDAPLHGSVGHHGASDLVVRILRAVPHVKVMMTSRFALDLKCEHRFPVAGMSVPPPEGEAALCPDLLRFGSGAVSRRGEKETLDLTQYSAVELFLQGARRVQPGFEPTHDDLADIAAICRLVAGTPLAILLAAVWAGTLTPAQIVTQISSSFDFLEADWADLPPRSRSMRAVFDHSWNLLTERERQVFQGLSVFQGGFTAHAAEYVTGASLSELRALAARSLLSHSSTARYDLHNLLRQYAAERLRRAEQLPGSLVTEEAIRDRHSAYYTIALHRWDAQFGGPGQQAALTGAEADAANIRAAWHWAVERGQADRLDQALEGLEDLYWSSGRYEEGEAALRTAADRLLPSPVVDAGADGSSADRLRLLARILAWQGNFHRLLGRRDQARKLHQQGLALLEGQELAGRDTRRERALLFWLMGHTAFLDNRQECRQLYEHSLALCRELDDRRAAARALSSLGTAGVLLGALDEARAAYEEALDIYRARDDSRRIVRALASLAEIALFQGRFGEADRLARQSVHKAAELGNQPESAFALLIWGETLEAHGLFSKAQSALGKSLAIYDDLGHYNYIASVQAELGSVNLHMGCYPKARAHGETALALARKYGPSFRAGFALTLLGCVALTEGKSDEAHRLLEESITIYRAIGPRSGAGFGWSEAVLGYAACEQGDYGQAYRHLGEALRIGLDTGTVIPLLWALPGLALLLAKSGEMEQAVELWALASSYPLVANSRWFHDVVGKQIGAAVPSGLVVAAQGHDRSVNLWNTAAGLLKNLPQRPAA